MSTNIGMTDRPASGLSGNGTARSRLPRWMPRLRSSRLAVDAYLIAEFLVIYACGHAAAAYHVGYNLEASYLAQYSMPLVALPLVFVAVAHGRRLYEFHALCAVSNHVGRAIGCLIAAFAIVIALGFGLGVANDFSRIWLGLWFGSSAAALVVARIAAGAVLVRAARAGLIRRRTIVYGNAASVARVDEEIARSTPEMQVVGMFYSDKGGYPSNEGHARRMLADLVSFAQSEDVDLVIVARDAFATDSLPDALAALSVLPAEVQLFLDAGGSSVPVRGVSTLNGLALLDVQRRPISGWNRLLKAVEDYAIAGVALVALAPVFLLIAAAIRLDSAGPVFFRQRRHGLNHAIINVWKFRTMHVMEDGDDVAQAVRGDSRVTRVGRFLRRTSLDELPQLFNVLAGEMSIVGPRPHPLALNNHYVELLDRYGNRHKVKPGITGWAQINGFRGPTEDPYLMQRRVWFDLDYIERWSVWMDLKIIALTPFRGLVHPNAL